MDHNGSLWVYIDPNNNFVNRLPVLCTCSFFVVCMQAISHTISKTKDY